MIRLHYSRTLDAHQWRLRHQQGEVPDRWPYGLHRLADHLGPVEPVTVDRPGLARIIRRAGGGYDWDRLRTEGRAAVCWDERAGVPVALSGVPTLTGVIWLTEPRRRHALDALARRALSMSTVFVNSPRQLPDLGDRWGVPRSRSHFVPFGVDDEFWHPSDGARDGVLVVGNDRHRDHQTAVRAGRLAGGRLTVVTRQPIPVPHVEHMTHRRLRRAYADHAVVAVATMPNRHASGLTVVLEAMACGRPVVATEGSGLEAYITQETGMLVPPGDAPAMARAVRDLQQDEARSLEMGRAGRASVERLYNTRVLSRALAELATAL